MTKFKLELFKKKPTDKLAMGATHIAAMTGNPNYPAATRVPTDAQVQTAQDDLAAAESAVDATEIAWKQAIQVRDQKEATWDTVITARANNCEAVTPNDAAALASTGFPLRSGGGPIGSLPAPEISARRRLLTRARLSCAVTRSRAQAATSGSASCMTT
jgi:hypothetical protein